MKTKIINLVIVTFLLCSAQLKAQMFSGGIMAGVSTSTVKVSHINDAFANSINGKNILGFEGGVFAQLDVNPFYIKPMLLASYQGGTADFTDSDGKLKSSMFRDGKLEVPVLLGLKFFRVLGIEAGPVYNWLFYEKNDVNDALKIAPSGFGYRVGANVDLAIINLGVAYQGLTNNSSNSGNSTFQSPNELIFNIGIRIGKTGK